MTNVDEIIKINEKVIFDFYADWCMPCKTMEPIMDKIDEETDIKVVKIDVEKEGELAQLFGVQSIPTFVYYYDGSQIKEMIGAHPFATMLNVFA